MLTYVSRQGGVWPRQGGRCTGQDEAFPVTGSATRKSKKNKQSDIYLHENQSTADR